MLAFLVSISSGRFEDRRDLLLAEANSIGTTFLRAGTLPEPHSTQSRILLREYSEQRLKMAEYDSFLEAMRRSEAIHPLLWAIAQELALADPNPVVSNYISSLNETIDLHASRVNAIITARLPFTIYIVMYSVALLGLFMLGYQSGIKGMHNWIVTLVLIIIFSVVMVLVIDFDRSWGGLIQVNQQPMKDLIGSLRVYLEILFSSFVIFLTGK